MSLGVWTGQGFDSQLFPLQAGYMKLNKLPREDNITSHSYKEGKLKYLKHFQRTVML